MSEIHFVEGNPISLNESTLNQYLGGTQDSPIKSSSYVTLEESGMLQ